MLIDFVTNSRQILDYTIKNYGGRFKRKKFVKILKNIPAGLDEFFYRDLDEFVKRKKINLEVFGYLCYNSRKELVREIGNCCKLKEIEGF